jgi:hypothetical protein
MYKMISDQLCVLLGPQIGSALGQDTQIGNRKGLGATLGFDGNRSGVGIGTTHHVSAVALALNRGLGGFGTRCRSHVAVEGVDGGEEAGPCETHAPARPLAAGGTPPLYSASCRRRGPLLLRDAQG